MGFTTNVRVWYKNDVLRFALKLNTSPRGSLIYILRYLNIVIGRGGVVKLNTRLLKSKDSVSFSVPKTFAADCRLFTIVTLSIIRDI